MAAFKTKHVNTQSVGEFLKERRQQLNLSQKEVSLASMVQVKYIEAFETSSFSQLPAEVYVKGFLQGLAKIYDLDSESLLSQYLVEKQIDANLSEGSKQESGAKDLMPKFVISPKTVAIMTAGFIGLVSVGYLFSQFRSISAPPDLALHSPAEDGVVSSGLLLIRGETETGSEVLINNQPIVVDANGEFLENISLTPGSNQIVISATNKFDQKISLTRTIVFEEKSVAGSFAAAGTESDSLSLEIAIGDQDSWISVTADSELVFEGSMSAGSTRKIEAQERIFLTTGNAGTTRVFLNNRDLGFLGEEGEVLRDVEFTN